MGKLFPKGVRSHAHEITKWLAEVKRLQDGVCIATTANMSSTCREQQGGKGLRSLTKYFQTAGETVSTLSTLKRTQQCWTHILHSELFGIGVGGYKTDMLLNFF
jgi:hypothetical protein